MQYPKHAIEDIFLGTGSPRISNFALRHRAKPTYIIHAHALDASSVQYVAGIFRRHNVSAAKPIGGGDGDNAKLVMLRVLQS